MNFSPAMGRLITYALVLLCGALLSQALAPRHWIWTVPVSLGLLPILLRQLASASRWAIAGWTFGLGYFAFGLSWILEPFQVDASRHGWMAPFALFFLSAGLSLFWAFAFWLAGCLRGGSWVQIVALTVFWSRAEFARAYLFTGFPWAAMGQFWIETPIAALLAYIGPQGLGILTLVTGLSLGAFVQERGSVLKRLTYLVPLAVLGILSFFAVSSEPVTYSGKTVRLIQPNAPQHQKWDPAFIPTFYQRQLSLSSAAPEGRPPDLVIWPETSVPVLLGDAPEVLAQISSHAYNVPVIVGIQSEDAGDYNNALVQVGADGQVKNRYNKHHLVPFGEYVPLENLMHQLVLSALAATIPGGFSPGPGPQVIEIEGFGKLLPLICYEAVFPQDIHASDERPDLLVQITNDAWFGAFSGPYQHLVQARMRAVEQGVPMVRAANTGISAVIDPHGRIVHALPLNEAGFLDAPVPLPLPATPYARTGDLPLLLLLLTMAALLRIRFWQRASEPRAPI